MAFSRSAVVFTWCIIAAFGARHASALPAASFSWKGMPEEHMNVSEIIRFFGYPAEEHTVVTEDGYILSLQRIPRGRSGVPSNGNSILLQHGLLSSSADWVMNYPDQSLGFILADAGYDVWLGNSRGNTYSNKHVHMTEKDAAFWSFSWDEMARYDFPASVDYISRVSGREQIFYAGHSQGTLMAFAAFSSNQEVAKKVKLFVALAPVMTVGHIKGAMKVLSHFTPELELLFKVLGVRDFLPNNWLIKLVAEEVCSHQISHPACASIIFLLCGYDSSNLNEFLVKLLGVHDFLPSNALVRFLADHVCSSRPGDPVCANILFLLCGYDVSNLNETRLPIYFSHTPAGTSVQDVVHFAQMVRSKKFQMYDYGLVGNFKHYGQVSPPVYNVTNVEVPTALYTATNDWLADPEDVKILLDGLRSTVRHQNVENWNHLDFIWGEDANKLIYADILKLMKQYH